LYKKDSQGKIRVFKIAVEEDRGIGRVVQETGLLGGKLVPTVREFMTGTNIGKANEKTPYEVAVTEGEHRVSKKKDGGYKEVEKPPITVHTEDQFVRYLSEKLPDILEDASGLSKPMLAKTVNYEKVEFPVFCQPKLNGVRCMIREVDGQLRATSRGGKSYDVATQHIMKELLPHMLGSGLVLDGELYKHGWSVQKISGLARTQQLSIEHMDLEFWVYDVALEGIEQAERIQLFNAIPFEELKRSKRVSTHTVSTIDSIKSHHNRFVEQGFEGAILRHPEADYGFGKRDWRMQKVKEFMDQEFVVIGGKTTPGVPIEDSFVFKLKHLDKEFYAKPRGSADVRRNYAANLDKIIGEFATVRFFEWTDDEVPFHGHVVTIRNYE